MNIGGINRIKSMFGGKIQTDLRGNKNTASDRDADGRQQQQRQSIKQLTPEQESQAVNKLNSLPSFLKLGLIASLVREEGKATHVVVRNPQGETVRQLSYEQLIDLYLERNSEGDSGRLLKRAA